MSMILTEICVFHWLNFKILELRPKRKLDITRLFLLESLVHVKVFTFRPREFQFRGKLHWELFIKIFGNAIHLKLQMLRSFYILCIDQSEEKILLIDQSKNASKHSSPRWHYRHIELCLNSSPGGWSLSNWMSGGA